MTLRLLPIATLLSTLSLSCLLASTATSARADAALAAPPRLIAPSVYARLGDNAEITPSNRGRVANTGFIVGRRGIIAIDTGVSYLAGKDVIAAIAGITPKPVEVAVLTHATQEFIFGAHAFQQDGIAVLAHRKTAALIRQRCEHCLTLLRQMLGDEAMRETQVPTPDRLIDRSTTIDLGQRKVDLLYYGWAGAPGDLAVFDRTSGTLFAGGLVSAQRIPNLRDAQLDGWLKALEQLRKLPVKQVVPGFGPVGDKAEIDRMLEYLRQLQTATKKHYREGDSLIETMRSADLPAFRNWQGYDTRHAQNVLYVYRGLEDADFR
jgi:glyoxylase-like metal-dependent hydrolase (beta-lactamase superfamily II)